MKIWRMRITHWIPKATHKHTEHVIRTYCFPTTTTVARTRLDVTLHVRFLSSFLQLRHTTTAISDMYVCNLSAAAAG